MRRAEGLSQRGPTAASLETGRGLRLSKEKQSLKIDGALALSFPIVAVEKVGQRMDPEDFRNSPPINVITSYRIFR